MGVIDETTAAGDVTAVDAATAVSELCESIADTHPVIPVKCEVVELETVIAPRDNKFFPADVLSRRQIRDDKQRNTNDPTEDTQVSHRLNVLLIKYYFVCFVFVSFL